MNQYALGDLVKIKESVLFNQGLTGVVVAIYEEDNLLDVLFKLQEGFEIFIDLFSMQDVEKIPHPDLLRLDCIGKIAVEALGEKYDPAEYRAQIDRTISSQQSAILAEN